MIQAVLGSMGHQSSQEATDGLRLQIIVVVRLNLILLLLASSVCKPGVISRLTDKKCFLRDVAASVCVCVLYMHKDVHLCMRVYIFVTIMDSLVFLNRKSCHSFHHDLVWDE